MFIQEVKGSIHTAAKHIPRAHAVSSCGSMSKGLAKEMTDLYPDIREKYIPGGVGSVRGFYVDEGIYIYNLITKFR
jgi:hypothetical protein